MTSNQQQHKLHYLDAMGIDVWVEKNKEQKADILNASRISGLAQIDPSSLEFPPEGKERAKGVYKDVHDLSAQGCQQSGKPKCEGYKPNTITATAVNAAPQAAWQELQSKAAVCTLCALSKTRTNVVFGVGNAKAEIMLVGEAPGANEDLQGEPFVGRAGMLLNAMLQAIGLERQEVYIANVLKCRPPNNRDPVPQEVAACTPYLQRQIALMRPQVIIAVGRVAAQFLLGSAESMARLRGRQYAYGEFNTPLFVIYHPAYLLRSPSEKRKAYEDLLKIKTWLIRSGGVIPPNSHHDT